VLKKKHLGEDFYDLLGKVLRYSPKRRFTPLDSLMHLFFDELRQRIFCETEEGTQHPRSL
jgi:serine/threonine protein kinase